MQINMNGAGSSAQMLTEVPREIHIASIVAEGPFVKVTSTDGTFDVISRKDALLRAQAIIGMSPIWEDLFDMLVCAAGQAYQNEHKKPYTGNHITMLQKMKQVEVDRLRSTKAGVGV